MRVPRDERVRSITMMNAIGSITTGSEANGNGRPNNNALAQLHLRPHYGQA